MKGKKELSKGEFQHRIFKLVILIIVFIFCSLIVGFIYITITSSSPKSLKVIDNQYNTEESIIKSNAKYHKMIQNQDINNYRYIQNHNKTELINCDKNNFYKDYIFRHFPCIYKYIDTDGINLLNNIKNKKPINLNSKNIEVIDFIDKFMKLQSIEIYNKNNNNEEYFKKPKLDNIGRIIINNSIQKVHIYLSPISQIKYFNSYQNKSNSDIIHFYLKNNIDDKIKDNTNSESKFIIYYEYDLNEADFIYVPSYYFIQIKEPIDNLISYEYQDISPYQDMVFKILYSF